MVGRTLTDIRERLERLATPGGEYHLRCGRTGERPVPVEELRFPDRETAAEAVRAAHAYRATLRRYDPQAPWYDFVVCERATDDGRDWSFPQSPGDGNRALVAYCHDVAGATFEALSAGDHGAVERAVMDEYLAAAEAVEHRDRLCLDLLAAMSTQLDRLPVHVQREVVERATTSLPAVSASDRPVADALAHLQSTGLVAEYDIERRAGARSVRVAGYRLPTVDGQLPTLPVAVEGHRRAASAPVVTRARRREEGWELRLSTATEADGLAAVPVCSQ